ncbi:hypothetical protein PybrP1_002648 [[Pythium] brassicae (nom. inval.)]|nr:hypothetical protein PybrP1_002648 [[Pythium] brassicae (nom. inval.)]
MGKSVRKYRKSREYEYAAPPETASAYAIHDGQDTTHGAADYDPEDLLSSPREFVPLEKLAPGDSSPLHVVALLVAGGVGSTVLAAPFVFLEGGFVMTCFMVAFVALASGAFSVCLVQLGVTNGIYSLPGLAKLAFGTAGANAVGMTQLAVSCGLVLTYLAIIFQDLPVLLGHALHLEFDASGWPKESSAAYALVSKVVANRTLFAELFAFLVAIPLCLVLHSHRRAQDLVLAATLLLGITSLCVVGKAKQFHEDSAPSASRGFARDYLAVPATLCQAFGILSTQFASQHHVFHAFYAMRDRSVAAFAKLVLAATLVSVYLVYAFGIGGYVSFLSGTKADVTRNIDFRGDNRSLLPFWLAMPLCALFCIPLEVPVFLSRVRSERAAQEEVLFRSQPPTRQQYTISTTEASESSIPLGDESIRKNGIQSSYTRLQVAATFLVLALLVQVVAHSKAANIGTMLSVTGGIAGIALVFIVPAACCAKFAIASDSNDHSRLTSCLLWGSIALGVVAAIACVVSVVVQRG